MFVALFTKRGDRIQNLDLALFWWRRAVHVLPLQEYSGVVGAELVDYRVFVVAVVIIIMANIWLWY